jgi:hypothetical protein
MCTLLLSLFVGLFVPWLMMHLIFFVVCSSGDHSFNAINSMATPLVLPAGEYINIAPLLGPLYGGTGTGYRRSRVDELARSLRDHINVLSSRLPYVLLHIIASYAPPSILLAYSPTSIPMCYGICPLAAIDAKNYQITLEDTISFTNTSTANRRTIIAGMRPDKISKGQLANPKTLDVNTIRGAFEDTFPYTGTKHTHNSALITDAHEPTNRWK